MIGIMKIFSGRPRYILENVKRIDIEAPMMLSKNQRSAQSCAEGDGDDGDDEA